MNNYTSLELSRKLNENGCELESEMFRRGEKLTNESFFRKRKKFINVIGHIDIKNIPAYDILNDICVKYAKEFFGELDMSKYDEPYRYPNRYYPKEILNLLQENKKQEAEDYIWEHCLFNPKNKKR